ncbi:MAG: DUF308 domain-containing protein [Oscillospiraceae bacterium]
MRSVAPMKAAKIGYIIISSIICVLGAVLIVIPEFSTTMIGVICGIIFIAFGAIKLVGFFSKDLYRLAFQYDLAFGILIIAIGIIMLARPGSLMNFICIALGISILADGLFKIQISIESKRFGIKEWWLILAFASIAVILGLILVIRPTESSNILTVLLGMTLLSEGLLNISTMITAVKIIRHQQPDIIEAKYNEEREN